jgi:hypothetical protein
MVTSVLTASRPPIPVHRDRCPAAGNRTSSRGSAGRKSSSTRSCGPPPRPPFARYHELGGELAGNAWEVYLSDPSAQPDPATWRTEIVQPYRQA